MAKQLWTAHHKGQIFTRSATQRAYTHVIVNEYSDGTIRAASWAGSMALAISRCSQENRNQIALNRQRDGVPKVVRTDMIPCELEDEPKKVRRTL